jgi:hypothetical protein
LKRHFLKALNHVGVLNFNSYYLIWLILFIFFYCWGSGEPPLIKNPPLLSKVSEDSKKGYLEEAQQTLEEIKQEFKKDHSKYMANTNLKDFQSLINGLHQAEGLLGIYFQSKGSLNLKSMFAIGQNYSKEAVILFLQLQHVLGGVDSSFGSFSIKS